MRRSSVCCGLLLFATLLTGCHRALYDGLGCKFGCQGCGHRYWGAYAEDPPRPEPCDQWGNWVGNCGRCDGCRPSMIDRRAERFQFLQSRLACLSLFRQTSCCEDDACDGNCRTGGCPQESCGEAGCGEPGCGCGCTSADASSDVILDESHAVSSRSPKRTVQSVSRATVVSASAPHSNGGCNCGRH